MNNKHILLAPDDASVGGGAVFDTDTTDAGQQQQQTQGQQQQQTGAVDGQQAQGQQTGQQQTQTQQAGQAQPVLSAKEIADALKEAGIGQQPAAQQPREMSQDEFNRLMNVYTPDETLAARLMKAITDNNSKGVVEVMSEMLVGHGKQMNTMAAFIAAQLEEKLAGRFSPLERYISEARENQYRQEFYAENEDLKPYNALVEAVVNKIQQSDGFKGLKKPEAFKLVSTQVREVIKTLPGGNGQGQQQTQQKSTQSSKMSTLSGGGQGGVGDKGGTGKAQQRSPSHDVFD